MTNYINTKRIGITELRVGMFVSRLQTPWSATPFPLEGVLIKSHQDIQELSKYGNTLFIDQAKSLNSGGQSLLSNISNQTGQFIGLDSARKKERPWRKFCTRRYETEKSLGKEMKKANKVFDRVGKVFQTIRHDPELQRAKSTREVEEVSKAIVDSVLGHPDALVWIAKVKSCGGPIYDHTLRSAIWATLMGRSMGLLKSALHQLNEAIFLSGVGKMGLKKKHWKHCDSIEINEGFAEWSNLALRRLAHSKIEPKVLTIIGNMTERLNGTGYPNQKMGKAIPYLAQIAAIAETFDLTMNPPGKRARRSAGQALCKLYWCRDSLFDGDLIQELIQAVGLYPPGSQVTLSSEERAVVVEQTKERRIRATVAITHDESGEALSRPRVVRLGAGEYRDIIILHESGKVKLNSQELNSVNNAIITFHYGIFFSLYHQMGQLLR